MTDEIKETEIDEMDDIRDYGKQLGIQKCTSTDKNISPDSGFESYRFEH